MTSDSPLSLKEGRLRVRVRVEQEKTSSQREITISDDLGSKAVAELQHGGIASFLSAKRKEETGPLTPENSNTKKRCDLPVVCRPYPCCWCGIRYRQKGRGHTVQCSLETRSNYAQGPIRCQQHASWTSRLSSPRTIKVHGSRTKHPECGVDPLPRNAARRIKMYIGSTFLRAFEARGQTTAQMRRELQVGMPMNRRQTPGLSHPGAWS